MTELWRTLRDSEAQWDGGWPTGVAGRSRQPRGRARGRRPASRPARHRHDRRPRAGGRRRPRVRPRAGSGGPPPALAQAVAHGMIEEVPSRRLAYQFTHELVRRALYDRMPRLRRAELHLRVAEALERDRDPGSTRGGSPISRTTSPRPRADRRARPRDRVRAAGGRAAMATLAFDEAEARFATALELGMTDERRIAETHLELGTARFRAAGRAAPSRPTGPPRRSLATSATPSCSPTAAVGFEDACWRPAIIDQGAIELLLEASDALPARRTRRCASWPRRPGPRVRLRRRLRRREPRPPGGHGDGAAPGRPGRPAPRCSCAPTGRATSATRRDARHASEARELAQRARRPRARDRRARMAGGGLITLGELDRAREEHAEVLAIARRLRQPFPMHVAEHYGATLALCDGRLDEAEACANRSRDWALVLTGRPPSGDPRHPDVRHPPRAGPAATSSRPSCGSLVGGRRRRRLATRPRGAAGRARHGG